MKPDSILWARECHEALSDAASIPWQSSWKMPSKNVEIPSAIRNGCAHAGLAGRGSYGAHGRAHGGDHLVIDIPEREQRYAQWADRRSKHLSTLDIDLYGFLSGLTDYEGRAVLILPPVLNGHRSERLAGVLRDHLGTIESHELWSDIAGSAFLAGHLGITRPRLKDVSQPVLLDCEESEDAEIAVSGETPWIHAFGPILQSLTRMYLAVFARTAGAREELGTGIRVLPEWTRTYPRRLQARFLSLGAQEADRDVVPAFLVDDAAFVPTISPVHNLEVMCDLSPLWSAWAAAACESGLVRIRSGDLPEDIRPEGGRRLTRLNEANVDNPPILKHLHRPQPSRGYLIDRHYQALFEDNVMDAVMACYGPNDRFKDACTALLENVDPVGVMRVKHWSVPVLEAASIDDVQWIVNVLTSGGRVPAYFRGQTRQYYLDREDFVNEFLYGASDVSEPSLPGAAARRVLSYDIAHSALQCLFQDFAYQLAVADGRSISETHEAWLAFATSADGAWDAGVMALAQHYGVPTDGIDITRDLDVALWFATNRFVSKPDGEARYVALAPGDWPSAPAEWPAVFVIQPPTADLRSSVWSIDDLRELRLNGLRPERQRALFFMGATGIHQNRLAEALSCVIRLRPGIYQTASDYSYLFHRLTKIPSIDSCSIAARSTAESFLSAST